MTDRQPRESLRGAGRDASGPLIATWQTIEWIRDNGPADRDTIIASCSEFVDVGYARRWYARHVIRRTSNVKRRITREQTLPPLDISKIPPEKARRAVIVKLLGDSTKLGSLARDEQRLYHFVRMPKRTPGGLPVEAVTSDPATQLRHVYAVELVRQLRKASARGAFAPGSNAKRLTQVEREALFRWLSTFDALDDQGVTVTGVELEAIIALRAMRDRQARETSAEKATIEALWRQLDHFA